MREALTRVGAANAAPDTPAAVDLAIGASVVLAVGFEGHSGPLPGNFLPFFVRVFLLQHVFSRTSMQCGPAARCSHLTGGFECHSGPLPALGDFSPFVCARISFFFSMFLAGL